MGILASFQETIGRIFAPGLVQQRNNWREAASANAELLEESLAASPEAVLRAEDREYQYIGRQFGDLFSAASIKNIIRVSRFYFHRNPIIKRGVMLQSFYVFGRGFEVKIEDDPKASEVVEAFVKANKGILGVAGMAIQEQNVQNDGNLFVAAFANKYIGTVALRIIDPLEIHDILTDPEDAETPQYYIRKWREDKWTPESQTIEPKERAAAYPAMGYNPEGGYPSSVMGYPVLKDVSVYHRKINFLIGAKFGAPDAWPAFAYAKAYEQFMNAWLSKQQALARFAAHVQTKGGAQQVEAVQSRLQSGITAGHANENNPSPVTGSFAVTGPGTSIDILKTAGAATNPDEARRPFLMAIMLFGPETFFGDASVGSLATAQSLDRPTELKFAFAQERWKEDIATLCSFALASANIAPGGEKLKSKTPPTVLVSFPPMLEHAVTEQVTAIVDAMTLKGNKLAGVGDIRTVAAMLLHVLGIKNTDEILDKMYPPGSYDAAAWAAQDPADAEAVANELANRMASTKPNNPQEAQALQQASADLHRVVEVMRELKNKQ